MKKLNLLILSTLAFMAMNASAQPGLPENAISEIIKKFPQCSSSVANASPIMGSLYGENTQDIVTQLTCDEDAPRILVLIKKDGSYQVVGTKKYDTAGTYDGFGATIDRKSLFIHISYPGRETADVYDYQFRYNGKNVMLIGMEFQTFYHGGDEPNEKNADYHVSVNYLTGAVIDSRKKVGTRKKVPLKKITLEEFYPGMEFLEGVIDGN